MTVCHAQVLDLFAQGEDHARGGLIELASFRQGANAERRRRPGGMTLREEKISAVTTKD
jgi:hypothetical protein